MMRFPLLSVAVLLLAAVSAPAQISIEAKLGRNVRAGVVLGGRDHGSHDHGNRDGYRVPRDSSRRCPPPAPRGHWETVHEQVLVPGYWHDEHVPATYGWIYSSCGHRQWGLIDAGGCRRVWVPARWETQCRQVWVPACH
jgi:hypothetical protein